jgi:hypothetical protein
MPAGLLTLLTLRDGWGMPTSRNVSHVNTFGCEDNIRNGAIPKIELRVSARD